MAPSTVRVEGDVQGLTLDMTEYEVAGRLEFDGHPPSLGCGGSGSVRVTFRESRTWMSRVMSLRTCSETEGWTFSGSLHPGTYQVTLEAHSGLEPFRYDYSTVLHPALTVGGPQPDLVLTAVVPEWREVSGSLTLNGQPLGAADCRHRAYGSFDYSNVRLVDEQLGNTYLLPITCGEGWTFSGRAPAGTYRVEVRLDEPRSHLLPVAAYVLNPRLQLP